MLYKIEMLRRKKKKTDEDSLLPATTELIDIANEYNHIMFLYESAITQIESKLQILAKEFKFCNDRNPIESIKSRVKSPESIKNKLQRKVIPLTLHNITTCLNDIAGIRVICPFIKDVYKVAEILLNQNDIHLLKVKDYICHPKVNGYRSLHIIISVEVYFSDHKAAIPVELQLRTIAMDFWASLEHQLRYKKDYKLSQEIQDELKKCSITIAQADEQMQSLADQLPEFQEREDG